MLAFMKQTVGPHVSVFSFSCGVPQGVMLFCFWCFYLLSLELFIEFTKKNCETLTQFVRLLQFKPIIQPQKLDPGGGRVLESLWFCLWNALLIIYSLRYMLKIH